MKSSFLATVDCKLDIQSTIPFSVDAKINTLCLKIKNKRFFSTQPLNKNSFVSF